MRRTLLALLLAVTAAVAAPVSGTAQPPNPDREPGNGPERNEIAAVDTVGANLVLAQGENQADRYQGYPRRTKLRTYPENPADKTIKLNLAPYHSLAPKLNALQQKSNRISVEVAGQSGLGRDLYLVTLTAPESPAETRLQEQFRANVEEGRKVPAGLYKAPVWINNNIHGDEWEGTDGALRVIEHLATSNDRETQNLLRRSRIYFNLTANPDGRVAGTRQNNAGFDLNRDFVTSSQPENRAMREMVENTQPLMMLDEHGYVQNTLIEPTTPPHGQNYDFDLYIKHGLANGLVMEKGVQSLGHPEAAKPEIPFRDYDPGVWDGWAPIYTAQYSMYHGAISYTIEIPQQVNRQAYETLPAAELQRRAKINTDVVESTIKTTIDYVDDHRGELISNQVEMFRRGKAGEPQREIPDGFVPGFGPEDRYRTEFPRAYVITNDRSGPAAARLVDLLVSHDVRVERAEKPFTLGGKRYSAGSYVVDMHQPKRALANVMLEQGSDISAKVPVMYDISGWSHRLLWGASIDIYKNGAFHFNGKDVVAAAPTGNVDAVPGADLALTLNDAKDANAVNDLLGRGIVLRRQDDGTIVVPAAERLAAKEVADRYGVRFTTAKPGGTALQRKTIAAAVGPDELQVLRESGFDVRTISTNVLNAGFDWSRIDVLFVSSGLNYAQLNATAKAALDEFLKRGGVVTRGATGGKFNVDAKLLQATPVAGWEDANGVVNMVNGTGPIGTGALPHSFVYSPQWFTNLGTGVTVEQRYGSTVIAAGHWRPRDDGTGGQDAAVGQAAVVSGTSANGAKVVLFGTEPMFRNHPKGLYAQVARAIFWTGTR
ncbi:M14 family zinc carboxypeptidase [Lentzea sp. BCCO 10_0856]|uniref:M14 family zinc carboxypeptidase n=1 Tax=Lentzea miocenica TaxID=3095431 RepID=A0ABU4SXZ1_9PSEU|nr:M14 family zinc carboxypeptidase [Lentzea sp. BCCO 10_0856]MDX8030779.1 M14 family zinc carboxypeptidase [Lentzea sp. BCCO 10_0856]